MDTAALRGTGAGSQPSGVVNVVGIGDVDMGSPDGGAPTWPKVVELESDVGAANALMGSLAYIVNSATRGKLKTTLKEPGDAGAGYLWQDLPHTTRPGGGLMNGYPVFATNILRSNLTKGAGTNLSEMVFGNWADLLLGEWGILEVVADPWTDADKGGVIVRAFFDVDVNVRHPESFSASDEVDTA